MKPFLIFFVLTKWHTVLYSIYLQEKDGGGGGGGGGLGGGGLA